MKGAIFDMDGTLFDTESIWQKYWNEAAIKRGIELPEDFKYEICGSTGDNMYNIIRKYYHTDDPYSIYDETFNNYEKEIITHIEMKEGVLEILNYLKDKGYKLAIASSSRSERIENNITKANIKDYFDTYVGGEEVEYGKPHPDIFLKASSKLGLDPKDCYVFEDAYNGVNAAHSTGCKVIMVPDLMEPNKEIKSKCTVYKSLLDVIKDMGTKDI